MSMHWHTYASAEKAAEAEAEGAAPETEVTG